jgi:hypothetical protein
MLQSPLEHSRCCLGFVSAMDFRVLEPSAQLNDADFVLKALVTLHGRQLLDVHQDPMPTHRDMVAFRLLLGWRLGQPLLLQDPEHRTLIGLRKRASQRGSDANGTMTRMQRAILLDGAWKRGPWPDDGLLCTLHSFPLY